MVKKVMNDPDTYVEEVIEGFVRAYGRYVRKLEGYRVLVRRNLEDKKVGILIGGGSGHEPFFTMMVGKGMADASVYGNIFAAPVPKDILAATREINRGEGVIYVYGNYTGDNLNFDMARELAEMEGIRVGMVRIWDDITSAPKGREEERRGIAGDFFVVRIAGACSDAGYGFEESMRVIEKARDNTRSIGIALAPGTLPTTGKKTFELGEDEIEIGMGAHGEKGVFRGKMKPARELVKMMMDLLFEDGEYEEGDEVCVLINGMGSTTYGELCLAYKEVNEYLKRRGVKVYSVDIGNFLTTQEMAGFSITLFLLDEELKKLYDTPVDTPTYKKFGR